MRFTITGSQFKRADSINRAILYTASECAGCFDRAAMREDLAALKPGESVEYAALRFVDGPDNPAPIVITREK